MSNFTVKKDGIVGDKFILIITFTRKVTDVEFTKFLALLDKLIDSKQKFALLIDARLCESAPIKATILLSSWMKKRKNEIVKYLIGSAIVFSSNIIISLVNIAFSIQKPKNPNMVTKNYDNAHEFLTGLVSKTEILPTAPTAPTAPTDST